MSETDGLLPRFAKTTTQASHTAFLSTKPWGSNTQLLAVLDLIDTEIDLGRLDVDSLSRLLSPLLLDLKDATTDASCDSEYVRLYLSFRMAMECVGCGRWSRAYEWLLCGLSDLQWTAQSAGEATEADHFPSRLLRFFNDQRLVQVGDARRTVLGWIETCLYYSWKEGGHRELVGMVLDDVKQLLPWASAHLTDDEQKSAVDASCHLATWLSRNDREVEANASVASLEAIATAPGTNAMVVKTICIQLSCRSGQYSTKPSHEWAEMGLQHADLLVGHEKLQLLINRSTRSDAVTEYEGIAEAAAAIAVNTNSTVTDTAAFNYVQARLFDVIRPFLGRLVCEGRPDLVLSLLGAWYSVPLEHQRIAPVLVCAPTFPDGPVFAGRDHVLTYVREPDAYSELFRIQNIALGSSNTIADDASFAIHPPEKAGIWDTAYAEAFEKALVRFYCLDKLAIDSESHQISATALLPIQSLCHPLQALMQKHLDRTWPIVTSYEEPSTDRKLRRVMLWSAGGTMGGHTELDAVSAIMQSAQIEVTKILDDLTPEQFFELYDDSQFDALWINAHGEFSAPDPHAAHILLSVEKEASISLSQLAERPVPANNRRLLFLNICDGGNVMTTDAPPRLGIAPLLASRNQAVISHLWPARSFVASAFGTLIANNLTSGTNFFDAFQNSLYSLRCEEEELLSIFDDMRPRPDELIDRLSHGGHLRDRTLFDWGSPVFYE